MSHQKSENASLMHVDAGHPPTTDPIDPPSERTGLACFFFRSKHRSKRKPIQTLGTITSETESRPVVYGLTRKEKREPFCYCRVYHSNKVGIRRGKVFIVILGKSVNKGERAVSSSNSIHIASGTTHNLCYAVVVGGHCLLTKRRRRGWMANQFLFSNGALLSGLDELYSERTFKHTAPKGARM